MKMNYQDVMEAMGDVKRRRDKAAAERKRYRTYPRMTAARQKRMELSHLNERLEMAIRENELLRRLVNKK